MDTAMIVDASNGQILSKKPLTFLRLPEQGERIRNGNSLWTVAEVTHAWSKEDVPVAWLYVSRTSSNMPNASGFDAFSNGESET